MERRHSNCVFGSTGLKLFRIDDKRYCLKTTNRQDQVDPIDIDEDGNV